jgi:thiol:disulfide interchange protein DsbD
MRFLPYLACLLLPLSTVAVADSAVVTTEHVRAELVAQAPDGVVGGKSIWLGLAIEHAPHWHSYWKNPGDAGLPTTLSWDLPAGVQAGDIQWPTPRQLPVGPLTNYGYEGRLLLPVKVTIPEGFATKTLDVKLRAKWLVCEEICIPESGEFSLRVPANAATVSHAALFATTWASLPTTPGQVRATTRVEGQSLAVEISELPSAYRQKTLQFFAETAGVIDHAAPIKQHWDGARWIAQVALSAQRSESPSEMYAVLTAPGQPAGIRVRLTIGTWPNVTDALPLSTNP